MMPTIVISPGSSTRAVASEGVQKLKKVPVSEVAKHHATLGFGFSANSPTRETGPRTELGIEVAEEHIAKLVAMLRAQLMACEGQRVVKRTLVLKARDRGGSMCDDHS